MTIKTPTLEEVSLGEICYMLSLAQPYTQLLVLHCQNKYIETYTGWKMQFIFYSFYQFIQYFGMVSSSR